MSRPDGYMIKGRIMPARSERTEQAMMQYIEQLEKLAVIAKQVIDDNSMFGTMTHCPTGFSSHGIDGKILWALKIQYEFMYPTNES